MSLSKAQEKRFDEKFFDKTAPLNEMTDHIKQHFSQELARQKKELAVAVRGMKVREDGDKDAPVFDQSFIIYKQMFHNKALDQALSLLEEDETKS